MSWRAALAGIVVAVALGMVVVHQQCALVKLGYRINELRHEQRELLKDYHTLGVRHSRLLAPQRVRDKVAALGLSLAVPRQVLAVRASADGDPAVAWEQGSGEPPR